MAVSAPNGTQVTHIGFHGLQQVIADCAEFLAGIVLANTRTREGKARGGSGTVVKAAPAVPTDSEKLEAMQVVHKHFDLLLIGAGNKEVFDVSPDGQALREKLREARSIVNTLEQELKDKFPETALNDARNSAAKEIAKAMVDVTMGQPVPNSLRLSLSKFVDLPEPTPEQKAAEGEGSDSEPQTVET